MSGLCWNTFPTASGFALTASKKLSKSLLLEGGYASIDSDYTVYADNRILDVSGYSLNGDAYSLGNRLFARANYKVNSLLTLFGFYTHIINTDFYTTNRQGMNFGATVDFKAALQRLH